MANGLYALSGFLVGLLVGLAGVGGGSLMTPLLVLLFGVHPATLPPTRKSRRTLQLFGNAIRNAVFDKCSPLSCLNLIHNLYSSARFCLIPAVSPREPE